MIVQNNNSHKVLIIYDSVSYFIPLFINKGLPVFNSFKQVPNIFRILRIFIFLHLPLRIWYGNWKKYIAGCDVIIFFETQFIVGLINYIHNKYPNKRLILWYWNPVIRSLNPIEIPDSICEKWSFDKADCQKFGMKSNTTFYFDNVVLPKNNIIYDIFFIGIDKGRRNTVEQLENEFKKIKLKVLFYIIDHKRFKAKYKNYRPISYQQALCYISQSKAILDILPDGQSGASLRTMESIFFSKKLVTNYEKIIECDFYHPDNVFVLNIDSIKDLPFFLNSPYHKLPEKVVAKYDVGQWLERFFEEFSQNSNVNA